MLWRVQAARTFAHSGHESAGSLRGFALFFERVERGEGGATLFARGAFDAFDARCDVTTRELSSVEP